MFSTGIQHDLQARHFLRGNFGDESHPHSHPYRVELICRTSSLDSNGFSTDIDLLESSLSTTLSGINDVLLNDLPYFQDRQPSLENLCMFIFQSLKKDLAGSAQEIEVRIWESATAWAAFSGSIDTSEYE